MRVSDLEALGIRVEVLEEIPDGIVAVVGPAGVGVIDLRPRPGQYAEAEPAPFQGEWPETWPLRSTGLPFDWERDLPIPGLGDRRV